LRNWILAADLAREDWERDTEFLELVTRSLALQTTFLAQYTLSLRFGGDTLDSARALGLAGKFFDGNAGAELRSAGRAIISREIEKHSAFGGACAESRPDFQLRLAQAVIEFLIFNGGEDDEGRFLNEKTREILKGIEGILLPDGTLPLFGPSPPSSGDNLSDLFAVAAVYFEEPLWKNLAGKFGVLPYMLLGEASKTEFDGLAETAWKPDTRLQPHSGLYRLSKMDTSAIVINGRLPCSHADHQDGFSYELAISGQRVVVDSGACAQGEEPCNHFFSSAKAHNVLLVDSHGARCGVSDFPPSPSVVDDQGDGIVGLRLAQQGFSILGAAHQRAWFCLQGEAWVILDRLDGTRKHSATSLIHYFPTFEVEIKSDTAIARSRSLTLSVIPLGQSPPVMNASRGDHPAFPGWYAPET